MKFIKRMVVLGVLILSVSWHPAWAAEEFKIGSVNFQQALNEVTQGKRAKADLKAVFDSKQKKLDQQQVELKKMQEEFEQQKAVLSQEAMLSRQKTFSEKFAALQQSMGAYREELMMRESRMTAEILKNLRTVVADLARKEGFTLVVETSQDAVLYAEAKEDLTSRVISAYNKKFTSSLKTD